jgi:hypothetical protein
MRLLQVSHLEKICWLFFTFVRIQFKNPPDQKETRIDESLYPCSTNKKKKIDQIHAIFKPTSLRIDRKKYMISFKNRLAAELRILIRGGIFKLL